MIVLLKARQSSLYNLSVIVLFELLAIAVLIFNASVPFQNFEQAAILTAGCLVVSVPFLFTAKRRALFNTHTLFHLVLIVCYNLRASTANGQISHWFLWFALAQWMIVIYLALRFEASEAPSIFLAICLISPLYFHLLHIYNDVASGFPMWLLLLCRLHLLFFRKYSSSLETAIGLFFLICLAAIPFSIYAWRSIQLLFLTSACITLYLTARLMDTNNRIACLLGYLYLSVVFVIYGFNRELTLLYNLGSNAVSIRLSLVMSHNDLIPILLITSAFLLFFYEVVKNRFLKGFILTNIIGMAVLYFLTYSRNGWICAGVTTSAFIFLRVRKGQHIAWQRLILVGSVPLLILLVSTPARTSVMERLLFPNKQRIYSWQTGIETLKRHPFTGIGWENFYHHTSYLPLTPPFRQLDVTQLMLPIQTHSLFLDMAEAAGIFLPIVFLIIIFTALKRSAVNPAIAAGIAGVSLSALFDSAAFWPSTFPHYWVLLGFANAGRPAAKNLKLLNWLFAVLLLLGGVLPLLQERYLSMSNFAFRNGSLEKSERQALVAYRLIPFDIRSLEMLRDIALARKQLDLARDYQESVIRQKKNYAPAYAMLGQIDLYRHETSVAMSNLRQAQKLDPYNALRSDLYLVLSRSGGKESSRDLALSFTLSELTGDQLYAARRLLDAVSGQDFLRIMQSTVAKEFVSESDKLYAIDTAVKNLLQIQKQELASQLFSLLIPGPEVSFPDQDQYDYFATIATGSQMPGANKTGFNGWMKHSSASTTLLMKARLDILSGRTVAAKQKLREALGFYQYSELADDWEKILLLENDYDGLRRHWRTLQTLGISPVVQEWRIADSYVTQNQFAEAARAYHNVALYSYDDPEPHWLEARTWWLADDPGRAARANYQLTPLVPESQFYKNLYRAQISEGINNVRILRRFLPNEVGGKDWRVVIYDHPPANITFPPEIRIRKFSGQIAILPEAWIEQGDGVAFITRLGDQRSFFLRRLNPAQNPDERRWISFTAETPGKNTVSLATDHGNDNRWDWAVWFIGHEE